MNEYFLELLRAAIELRPPQKPPDGMDWEAMYRLAEAHSVANTLYFGIEQLNEEDRPTKELYGKFKRAKDIVLGRETMQFFELGNLFVILENEKVAFVPLKGWVMKNLYPRVEMRSMCDIDFLVEKKNQQRMPDLLAKAGFRLEHPGINHDEYIKGSTITTEVHWSLFVKESPYYSFFENVMERVHGKEKESFESEMSVEDFYLHLLAHMAKHFNEGGTGVRSVLDLWIYLKANREKIDREKLEDGLDKLGLRIFCQAMEELATSWFGPTNSVQETEVTRILGNFILTGNTYGNKEVNILARMYEQKGRRGSYLLKRCFPSVEKMSYEFPLLKKHAYLIPFCYLVRAFRILFFRRDNLTSELESVGKLDEQMILKMQKVKQLAGLGNGE